MSDQTIWEACTAHAGSRCLYTRLNAQGKPLPWIPSQLGIWSNALLLETSPTPTAKQLATLNQGVQSVSAMMSIGQGIRPMGTAIGSTNSDCAAPKWPGLDQITTEGMAPIVGQYRIDNSDQSWPTIAASCLDNGIPIWVAMNVGEQYVDWTATMPPISTAETSTSAGHAVTLDGYYTTGTGELIFYSPGSYGTRYADQGVWLFTGSGLIARAFDVYAFEVEVGSA